MIQFVFQFVVALLCVFVVLPVVIVIALPVVLVQASFGHGSYWRSFRREYARVIKWWIDNGIFFMPP